MHRRDPSARLRAGTLTRRPPRPAPETIMTGCQVSQGRDSAMRWGRERRSRPHLPYGPLRPAWSCCSCLLVDDCEDFLSFVALQLDFTFHRACPDCAFEFAGCRFFECEFCRGRADQCAAFARDI